MEVETRRMNAAEPNCPRKFSNSRPKNRCANPEISVISKKMVVEMEKNDQAILKSWEKSVIEIAYPEDVFTHDRIGESLWTLHTNTFLTLQA